MQRVALHHFLHCRHQACKHASVLARGRGQLLYRRLRSICPQLHAVISVGADMHCHKGFAAKLCLYKLKGRILDPLGLLDARDDGQLGLLTRVQGQRLMPQQLAVVLAAVGEGAPGGGLQDDTPVKEARAFWTNLCIFDSAKLWTKVEPRGINDVD